MRAGSWGNDPASLKVYGGGGRDWAWLTAKEGSHPEVFRAPPRRKEDLLG